MKMIVVIAAMGSLLFGAETVQAEPADFKTVGQTKTFCAGFGVFFPPNSHGVYGCLMNADQGGGLYICSPPGDLKLVTCGIYAKVAPHRPGQLPTQNAINAAVKADPSILTPDPHGPLVRRFHPSSGKIQEPL